MFALRFPRAPALRHVGVGLALLALTGCTATFRDHGYVPPAEDLAEIIVGIDTRDTVIETIGVPTSSGVLDDGGYYYVATRVRTFAYRQPKVIERELVAISFDARGVVRNIERYGLQDGVAVPLDRRVTDSSLRDQTLLRQLLGNMGRFAPGALAE
ncbi:MAG: outer membrane protein assembly factor BamE [Rhodobacteraceae bacterium]|nr:outer membrane protein assembly factor BamE [Paracoccaceae bacterium]